jgi:secreted PhoX family phosphatase
VTPVPLKAMGRFVHEACAVDPASGIVYETEDRGTSGFYRFLPDEPGNLVAGGKLQMLAVKGRPGYDTRTGQRVGKPLPVTWVDIANPDPANAGADPLAVFKQGVAGGGATFDRLEGCWYGDGSIFFVSTSGGDAGLGQVWEYRPRGSSGGQLILVFESEDADLLDAPDNLTVSPRGGLLLCEDGDGTQYLRGVNPEGQIFDFCRNDLNTKEFAGATYSPDGQTLFVNIQTPGISFAITGPFEKGSL